MSKDDDNIYRPNNKLRTGKVNATLQPLIKNLPSFEVNTKECLKNSNNLSLHASKVSVPSFGVSFNNIQPSYSFNVLRADQNVNFSHNSSLKVLSHFTPKLQCLKQDYDYLSCVNSILKLTLLLKNIEKTMVLLNLPLDDIKQSLVSGMETIAKAIANFNTSSVSLIYGLKECSSSINQSFTLLKDLGLSCSNEIHYEKVIKKFREFDCTFIKLSSCKLIAKYVKYVIQKILFLQTYLELPLHNEIQSPFVSPIISDCDVLLRSLQELSFEIRNFSFKFYKEKSENLQLSQGFLFVKQLPSSADTQVIEECSITSYVKEVAKWRSFNTAKRICMLIQNILVDKMKLPENISDNTRDKYSPIKLNAGFKSNKTLHLKSKMAAKLLRQNYCSFIAEEKKYFSEILKEISGKMKVISSQNNILPLSDAKNDKKYNCMETTRVVHWNSDMRPALEEFINELYTQHLWNYVNFHMKNSYICFLSCNADQSYLNNSYLCKVQSDILWSCINKLIKDEIPAGSLEAMSTLLVTITSFHNLQQWDHGFCKAMGAMLKDKFRYSNENPGIPASKMVNLLLRNQMRHMNIQTYFKFMLQKEILHYNNKEYSLISFHSSVFLPQSIFLSYLTYCLRFKRQQFLISGCWEQFFVVTSVDIKITLYFIDHLVNDMKENFASKSESLSLVINHLTNECKFMKTFEEQSFKMFLRAIRQRSRNCFETHMPSGKVWRRKGYSIHHQEVNLYVNVCTNIIFPPLLENLSCLSKQKRSETIQICFKLFIKTWMEFILDNQIMFSWYGANQLKMDFEHFLRWFEQDHFCYTAEELGELQPMAVLKEMRSAIILLTCQPQGRRTMSSNIAYSNPRLSTSSVSEVSMETFTSNQFDQVILDIDLHDKERWLALRVKTNQPNKFLCMS